MSPVHHLEAPEGFSLLGFFKGFNEGDNSNLGSFKFSYKLVSFFSDYSIVSIEMLKFACRILLNLGCNGRNSPLQRLYFLNFHPFSSPSSTLESAMKSSNQHSFAVNYLMSTFDFPPERALWATKYANFETPQNPDAVVAFFDRQGFTKPQISKIISMLPGLLMYNPEKSLLPKLECLKSMGISASDVAYMISKAPSVLRTSPERKLIPAFNYYKNLLESHEKTIIFLKRLPRILHFDLKTAGKNIEILINIGVPKSNIVTMLHYMPRALTTETDKFEMIVEDVKKLGFNPSKIMFIAAVHAIRAVSKSTWDKKLQAYKRWGLSEDEVYVAFGKYPWCMMLSEDKITRFMDFLVNEMGFDPSVFVKRPLLVSLSLEKRIVPRGLLYRVLLEKGLVKKNFSLSVFLESTEKEFVKRIEKFYGGEAPELLKLYREKLNASM